ncbi:putative amino acid permease [Paractinoplanes deccanensis]|uniref:Amino acid permease n=1 Tax=Paractinoplanes deccanensis TaxID=113561 RepID=A0ABQ3XZI2_9ACTN|nr:APC family permease [Actinoplanes deccanensis]GID73020.1 putative amino acid permease [Actinoplanes deccanensis]
MDTSTSLAREQTSRLHRSLGAFDIIFLMIAAVVGLETLGQVSTYGGEAFTWALVLAVTFLIPYGLIFAEVGSTFREEGGAYIWVRTAFGRGAAAIAALLTWVTQPVWVGGSMAFLAAETFSEHITALSPGSFADYAFKLIFIWITVAAAIVSLRRGKWLPTVGALLKVGLLVFFVLTTVIYAFRHGTAGLSAGSFSPTLAGLFGSVPVLLFAFLGFESSSSAAGEMKNPARDVPFSIFRSCAAAAACYLIPILAILLVIPADQITGIGGLLDAVATVYSVYGGAAEPLLTLTSVVLIVILASQGAAWMIVSDRMQAMAAADGSFFGGFFGKFSSRLGTPVRVNMLSGVVATVFLLASMQITGDNAAVFGVVLTISISTFLLSYLLVIPAAIKLRKVDEPRPYRVPVSDRGFTILGAICFAWVLLGSWVAVFPGTLEALFGLDYSFTDIWGVSQATFEAFTLGTLGVLLVLGIAGYARGARVRNATPLDEKSLV